MPSAILYMGIPDDGKATVKWLASGKPTFVLAGISRLATDLSIESRNRLVRVFFGPSKAIRIPPEQHGLPGINPIADPDVSQRSLKRLDAFLKASGRACFNHPAAVLGTTRERVADALSGIAGLQMPRTVRLRIEEPADLAPLIESHGLHWPLILRCTGTHKGESMILVEGPDQIRAALRSIRWAGRELYLTEYVDCRDADGHYRKLRLAVVGDQVFLRHLLIADQWMVHAADRKPGHLEEEVELLRTYRSTVLPALSARLDRIREAIQLDYFGIDCNLRPDGRLLIFEVNAQMDIMVNSIPSPNCWDAPISRIRQALDALLFDPKRWRYPPRATTET